MKYAVRHARCGLCGAYRPRRELKITMVAAPLWPPHGAKHFARECRAGHTPRQRERARREMWTALREFLPF